MKPARTKAFLTAVTARARRDEGFTMVVALGVLTVVTLLIGAAFVAANGDIGNAQRSAEGKRAYYSARAGVNAFLAELNQNPELWETCPSKAKTNVPGAGNQSYQYSSVPANGQSACSAAKPIDTMIDKATGTFRMRFTGYAGTPENSRTLIVSFRRDTPLDFLYYTIYETSDPNIYDVPANYQKCARFWRDSRSTDCSRINFTTGDSINGPMYTQDQFATTGTPTFGRVGKGDVISSSAPSNVYYGGGTPTLNGDVVANAPFITPPADNSSLLSYAQQDGIVISGARLIYLAGSTAYAYRDTSFTNPTVINLEADPIIYITNSSAGCPEVTNPYAPTYINSNTGCGNAFVYGSYSRSVTIAAQNDVIAVGDITTDLDGPAVMGLVANNFIRVMHAIDGRSQPRPGGCGSGKNNSDYSRADIQIDAAMLALNHSFIVDNYDCGAPLGSLEVNGAIAQLFRGAVGTGNASSTSTGYLKDYNYDDRLAVQQPPYLFDFASASWRAVRETACTPGATGATAC